MRLPALAAAVMLVAGGCAAQRQEVPASSVPVTWPAYVTSDGALRFEYPPGWSVAEVPALANDPAGGVSLEVADGSGRVLARLDTGIIADLSCTAPAEPAAYREYESVPMPELHSEQGTEQRFVYRSLAPSGQREAQATYAVVSGQQQGPPCGLFDFFSLTESGGGRFAGEYAAGAGFDEGTGGGDAGAYLDGAERYRETEEYRDLRRMLTSLRNAG